MVDDSPWAINSAMVTPIIGESLNPWPLKPTAQYNPSMPGTRSSMGCQSGVVVNRPAQPPPVVAVGHERHPTSQLFDDLGHLVHVHALVIIVRIHLLIVAEAQRVITGVSGRKEEGLGDVSDDGMAWHRPHRAGKEPI